MALKDISLTKETTAKAYDDLYSFTDSSYKQVNPPAPYFKNDLKYLIKIYSGICGEDEGLSRIFSNVQKYINIDKTSDNLHSSEAKCIKDILLAIVNYEKSLDDSAATLEQKVNKWLDKIDAQESKRLSPEQQQQNATFVGYSELTTNRRIALTGLKSLFLDLVQGNLPASDCPPENEDDESLFGTLETPIMTHTPYVGDLPKDRIEFNPLYKVLYNILNANSGIVPSLFHDYNNDNVCVRIWKKENDGSFAPNYYVLNKSDIFVNSVVLGSSSVLWLPALENALIEAGIDCFDAEGVAEALLGPNCSKEELQLYCGPLINPEYREDKAYNSIIEIYIKCFFEVYLAYLGTISITKEDDEKFLHIIYALKEVLYALLCCFYTTEDNAKPAMDLLLSKIDDFTKDINSASSPLDLQSKERLSICETAKKLSELFLGESEYHSVPKLYFENLFAEKIALSLLEYEKQEATKQNVDTKLFTLMSDDKFEKLLSNMNVHQLKSANPKHVEALMKKFLSK